MFKYCLNLPNKFKIFNKFSFPIQNIFKPFTKVNLDTNKFSIKGQIHDFFIPSYAISPTVKNKIEELNLKHSRFTLMIIQKIISKNIDSIISIKNPKLLISSIAISSWYRSSLKTKAKVDQILFVQNKEEAIFLIKKWNEINDFNAIFIDEETPKNLLSQLNEHIDLILTTPSFFLSNLSKELKNYNEMFYFSYLIPLDQLLELVKSVPKLNSSNFSIILNEKENENFNEENQKTMINKIQKVFNGRQFNVPQITNYEYDKELKFICQQYKGMITTSIEENIEWAVKLTKIYKEKKILICSNLKDLNKTKQIFEKIKSKLKNYENVSFYNKEEIKSNLKQNENTFDVVIDLVLDNFDDFLTIRRFLYNDYAFYYCFINNTNTFFANIMTRMDINTLISIQNFHELFKESISNDDPVSVTSPTRSLLTGKLNYVTIILSSFESITFEEYF